MPANVVEGFVLVGGRSSRMGRDKALLPWKGTTLAQYVAGVVGSATGGPVTLVGDPDRMEVSDMRFARTGWPGMVRSAGS